MRVPARIVRKSSPYWLSKNLQTDNHTMSRVCAHLLVAEILLPHRTADLFIANVRRE
jgi:hypothetical protein